MAQARLGGKRIEANAVLEGSLEDTDATFGAAVKVATLAAPVGFLQECYDLRVQSADGVQGDAVEKIAKEFGTAADLNLDPAIKIASRRRRRMLFVSCSGFCVVIFLIILCGLSFYHDTRLKAFPRKIHVDADAADAAVKVRMEASLDRPSWQFHHIKISTLQCQVKMDFAGFIIRISDVHVSNVDVIIVTAQVLVDLEAKVNGACFSCEAVVAVNVFKTGLQFEASVPLSFGHANKGESFVACGDLEDVPNDEIEHPEWWLEKKGLSQSNGSLDYGTSLRIGFPSGHQVANTLITIFDQADVTLTASASYLYNSSEFVKAQTGENAKVSHVWDASSRRLNFSVPLNFSLAVAPALVRLMRMLHEGVAAKKAGQLANASFTIHALNSGSPVAVLLGKSHTLGWKSQNNSSQQAKAISMISPRLHSPIQVKSMLLRDDSGFARSTLQEAHEMLFIGSYALNLDLAMATDENRTGVVAILSDGNEPLYSVFGQARKPTGDDSMWGRRLQGSKADPVMLLEAVVANQDGAIGSTSGSVNVDDEDETNINLDLDMGDMGAMAFDSIVCEGRMSASVAMKDAEGDTEGTGMISVTMEDGIMSGSGNIKDGEGVTIASAVLSGKEEGDVMHIEKLDVLDDGGNRMLSMQGGLNPSDDFSLIIEKLTIYYTNGQTMLATKASIQSPSPGFADRTDFIIERLQVFEEQDGFMELSMQLTGMHSPDDGLSVAASAVQDQTTFQLALQVEDLGKGFMTFEAMDPEGVVANATVAATGNVDSTFRLSGRFIEREGTGLQAELMVNGLNIFTDDKQLTLTVSISDSQEGETGSIVATGTLNGNGFEISGNYYDNNGQTFDGVFKLLSEEVWGSDHLFIQLGGQLLQQADGEGFHFNFSASGSLDEQVDVLIDVNELNGVLGDIDTIHNLITASLVYFRPRTWMRDSIAFNYSLYVNPFSMYGDHWGEAFGSVVTVDGDIYAGFEEEMRMRTGAWTENYAFTASGLVHEESTGQFLRWYATSHANYVDKPSLHSWIDGNIHDQNGEVFGAFVEVKYSEDDGPDLEASMDLVQEYSAPWLSGYTKLSTSNSALAAEAWLKGDSREIIGQVSAAGSYADDKLCGTGNLRDSEKMLVEAEVEATLVDDRLEGTCSLRDEDGLLAEVEMSGSLVEDNDGNTQVQGAASAWDPHGFVAQARLGGVIKDEEITMTTEADIDGNHVAARLDSWMHDGHPVFVNLNIMQEAMQVEARMGFHEARRQRRAQAWEEDPVDTQTCLQPITMNTEIHITDHHADPGNEGQAQVSLNMERQDDTLMLNKLYMAVPQMSDEAMEIENEELPYDLEFLFPCDLKGMPAIPPPPPISSQPVMITPPLTPMTPPPTLALPCRSIVMFASDDFCMRSCSTRVRRLVKKDKRKSKSRAKKTKRGSKKKTSKRGTTTKKRGKRGKATMATPSPPTKKRGKTGNTVSEPSQPQCHESCGNFCSVECPCNA